MAEIQELHPNLRLEITRLAAQSEDRRLRVMQFEENVKEFVRRDVEKMLRRNWNEYHGEEAWRYWFRTDDATALEPTPCCVCVRTIFGEGRGFHDKFTTEWKAICPDCYDRWNSPESA